MLIGLLSSANFRIYSKPLAKVVGTDAAILFSELCAKFEYYQGRGQLDNEQMFYSSIDDIEDELCLTRRQQVSAIASLFSANLVFTKVKGMPAKRYFGIHEKANDVLVSIFSEHQKKRTNKDVQNVQTVCTKRTNKDVQNVHVIMNSNNEYKERIDIPQNEILPFAPIEEKSAKEKKPKFVTILDWKEPLPNELNKVALIEKYNEFLSGKGKDKKFRYSRSEIAFRGEFKKMVTLLKSGTEEKMIAAIQVAIEREWCSLNQDGFEKEMTKVVAAKTGTQRFGEPNQRVFAQF